MSVEFDRGSPGKFDSRTLNRNTLSRWTGRNYMVIVYIVSSCMYSTIVCHIILIMVLYVILYYTIFVD